MNAWEQNHVHVYSLESQLFGKEYMPKLSYSAILSPAFSFLDIEEYLHTCDEVQGLAFSLSFLEQQRY